MPGAWLAVRHRGRLATALERSLYLGSSVPGIVVALALVTLAIRYARPLYQTVPLLVAGYVILFLPRAVVTVRAALAQAPPVLDSVAHSLGAGPLATLRRVTLPLIAPGLGAGAALVFLAVVTELTATLLLAPVGTVTLATEFWQQSNSLAYGAAAPYAAMMVLLSAPATFLLTREARPMTSLTLRGVTRSFGPVPVLSGVDLHVPERTVTAVLGPSGCGKTTLLRLVAGFDDPDSGDDPARRPRPCTAPAGPGRRSTAGSATCRRRARSSRTCRWPRTSLSDCRVATVRRRAGGGAAGAGRAGAGAGRRALRTSSPAASSSGSRWPGRSPRGRRSCCSTSRSRRWTRRCGTPPGGRSARRWPRPARPRCWSPTTRPRRCRWPTRSR